MQLAAQPDHIAELHTLANQLQNIPREQMATKEDILFFNRRVAGRIRIIADRIEIVPPKKTLRPRPAGIEHRPRGRREVPAQLALFGP